MKFRGLEALNDTYEPPCKCCKQKSYALAKPFSCNTYKNTGEHPSSQISSSPLLFTDVPTFVRSDLSFPILGILFQLPYPASPLFAALTKTPFLCILELGLAIQRANHVSHVHRHLHQVLC